MKKITTIATIAVLILAVLFSVLPSSTAQAASHADVTLIVKNHTNGKVTITLSNDDSGRFTFTFEEPGMYQVSLPEGKYNYYATTICGNESGQFNLNVSKHLYFSCKDGREITLTKPGPACSNYDFWHWYDFTGYEGGHWHPGVDQQYNYQQNAKNGYWELRCTDGDPTYGRGAA